MFSLVSHIERSKKSHFVSLSVHSKHNQAGSWSQLSSTRSFTYTLTLSAGTKVDCCTLTHSDVAQAQLGLYKTPVPLSAEATSYSWALHTAPHSLFTEPYCLSFMLLRTFPLNARVGAVWPSWLSKTRQQPDWASAGLLNCSYCAILL